VTGEVRRAHRPTTKHADEPIDPFGEPADELG